MRLALLLLVSCTASPAPPATVTPPEPCARSTAAPTSPLETGQRDLDAALTALGSRSCVPVSTADGDAARTALAAAGVTLDARPESYAIVDVAGQVSVIGRDATGAMYGAFELAERLRLDGVAGHAPRAPILGAPAVPIRGANLFLTLPLAGETAWWFLDDDFWTRYLDMLAHARMNFLDVHAMYDLENTFFPNALLYFATSPSFPQVGADPATRERNLAMLDRVVEMARLRGIRVGLMSYSTETSLDGTPGGPLADDADLRVYTREAAADLARRAPGVWRLGFRIGESARDASWYLDTFVAGVHEGHPGTEVYTRTHGTTKDEVLSVVDRAGGDVVVEAKYNGEHLGLPYVVTGGIWITLGYANYFYEDYLEPPAPYAFVFQVRSGGTHRIFRQASLARARRLAGSFTMSGARGFSLEPPNAFYPQRDFYHRPEDRFDAWTFRRDELFYALLGRLAYDPGTDGRVFRRQLAARAGTDRLWDAVQAASEVVPWITTAMMCGPDQRQFAPELEWGGTVGFWASTQYAAAPPGSCSAGYHGPFDTFAFASPFDAAADLAAGRATTRVSPLEVADRVLDAAGRARAAAAVTIDAGNPEARDLQRECVALADLGDYFGNKLRAATALAVFVRTGAADYLAAARALTAAAGAAWHALAADTAYIQPFDERMRMAVLGLSPYHWRLEEARLPDDPASIDALAAEVAGTPPATLPAAADWLHAARPAGPGLAGIEVAPDDPAAASWSVTVHLAAAPPAGSTVNLLWKPFSNLSVWSSAPTDGAGATWHATLPGTGAGALLAVEVAPPSGWGWRYPDAIAATPYVVVAPIR